MTDLYKSNIDKAIESMDSAIDDMDMRMLDMELENIAKEYPLDHELEESREFAQRIVRMNSKGDKIVMFRKRKIITLVATLVLLLTLGVTFAFGSGYLRFDFYNDDTTVNIKTNGNISDDEAKAMAEEAAKEYNEGVEGENVMRADEKSYDSIESLEKELGITVVLPKDIPDGFEMVPTIQSSISPISTNVYITYQKENDDRMLGISLFIDNSDENVSTVVTVTDAVYDSKYKSKSGIEYTLLNEDGGKIASTRLADYDYAVVTMGFDEDELKSIVDSVVVNQ